MSFFEIIQSHRRSSWLVNSRICDKIISWPFWGGGDVFVSLCSNWFMKLIDSEVDLAVIYIYGVIPCLYLRSMTSISTIMIRIKICVRVFLSIRYCYSAFQEPNYVKFRLQLMGNSGILRCGGKLLCLIKCLENTVWRRRVSLRCAFLMTSVSLWILDVSHHMVNFIELITGFTLFVKMNYYSRLSQNCEAISRCYQ